MATSILPQQNKLLAVLPPALRERLFNHLELVPVARGQVLHEAGAHPTHAWFPTTCIASLVYVMRDGASAEVAVVGNEGVVGVGLFMGSETTTNRAVVRAAGHALRLPSWVLRDEFFASTELARVLLRYAQSLLTQTAQTAACNRHHSVDQQLCRWLLLSLDRLPSNELNMTQELIANMLGVRREGVTEAAGKLQAAGLINYSRGHIRVIDRPRLETRSCECYSVVAREFAPQAAAAG